eukprot:COSAG02_NODE_160_length_32694_cov_18.496947_25_plen_64_part_00
MKLRYRFSASRGAVCSSLLDSVRFESGVGLHVKDTDQNRPAICVERMLKAATGNGYGSNTENV